MGTKEKREGHKTKQRSSVAEKLGKKIVMGTLTLVRGGHWQTARSTTSAMK
ncbi:MAG: hypothetical protein IJC23_02695 [Bacteroidaceae bacterium]|nr:hypothetical protein [Bacteroidaceae bacterium]